MPPSAKATEVPDLNPEVLWQVIERSPYSSPHDLALNAGVSPSVLYKFLNGQSQRLYSGTLLRLKNALPTEAAIFEKAMGRGSASLGGAEVRAKRGVGGRR